MPVRATRKYSRKPRKYVKRKPTVSKAVKKYVRRTMPAIERKCNWYHDNEVQLNTLSQGAMQGYPLVTQALAATGRIGNDINVSMFQIKGVLNNNSGSESWARCIVCSHDGTIDPNMGTFPLFVNGASNNTVTISTINGLDTMYYPLNKTDLTVYYDRKFRLAGSATGNAGNNTSMFNKTIKFPGKGKRFTFKGNTTGVNQQSAFISVIWIVADANDDTTTGTTVELSQLTRYWYTDV